MSDPDICMTFYFIHSFEINLLTGDSDNDDIAFHIRPQIGKPVALNSFINGSWETEEYPSDNPFIKDTSFHLFLVINSEGYEVWFLNSKQKMEHLESKVIHQNVSMLLQVYVNNFQHCTFKHRIPLEKVSTLGIRGDITINYFGFVQVSTMFFC